MKMFLDLLLDNFEVKSSNNCFYIEGQYYTYEQLHKAILSVQTQLHSEILNESRNVAIICTNDFKTYSSLLAVWFSGLAYVPLGLFNPVDRNLKILADANVSLIISSVDLNIDEYSDYIIINPELDQNHIIKRKLTVPSNIDDLTAYILFTSGSTGFPKGVPITFGSLNQFIINFDTSPFKVSEEDRCLQMFELTFDVSISSFLLPLIKGACIYTVSETGVKYIEVLRLMHEYKLTNIQIVPSIIKLARPLLKRISFPNLKFCILTGEATNIELLELWKTVVPNARIFNYYGPTEATIYCSFYDCNLAVVKSYNGMLSIGSPLGNMKLVIVDDNLHEVEVGQKGELLISGLQLTKGYLNNPIKNKESFIEITKNNTREIYYRSGDLCFKDEDNVVFYCGRLDNQVKIQGFRIELSEIEVLVRNKFEIENVALPISNKSDSVEIVLVLENKGRDLIEKVISYLKTTLPVYMIPSKVIEMDLFPLGSSGKTDKVKIRNIILDELC